MYYALDFIDKRDLGAREPFAVAVLSILVSGCGGSAASFGSPTDIWPRPTSPVSLFLIADPQVHNVYGGGIKQFSLAASAIATVAQRPPELNLLAPYVFSELAKQGLTSQPEALLILGDTTNAACSGEYDEFIGQLRNALGGTPNGRGSATTTPLVLMAHGNHDSYLAGTVNNYVPGDTEYVESLEMPFARVPTDESWFPPLKGTDRLQSAWPSVCSDDHSSSPMNKSRWLSKYLADFLGAKPQSQLVSNEDDGAVYAIEATSDQSVEIAGRWYPPHIGEEYTDYMRTSKSFIVQFVELSTFDLMIVDTSVCGKAVAGSEYLKTNTGDHGCLGSDQINVIDEFLGTRSFRPLIVTGHLPLEDIVDPDGLVTRLIDNDAIYLSAHTHSRASLRTNFGVTEVNISSTTDWPMEGMLLDVRDGRVAGAQKVSLKSLTPASYEVESSWWVTKLPKFRAVKEVCRHLPAARRLARMSAPFPRAWKPLPADSDCQSASRLEDVSHYQNELRKYVTQISERIKEDPYRTYALSLASEVSQHMSEEWGLSDVIH